MTMPDVLRLFTYWRDSPPAHELLAAWVGHKPDRTQPEAEMTATSELAPYFGPAVPPPESVREMVQWAEGHLRMKNE
jgi:hypothetical protein